MSDEEVIRMLLTKARNEGAEYPAFADAADSAHGPIIVDTGSGRTWFIELREF